ncbi:MAG: S24 family peptidase [Candidatus Paceibacterota bacterium]
MVKKSRTEWDALHSTQKKLLDILLERGEDEQYTYRQMAEDLGVSSHNTVMYHLDQLEQKGYIRRNSRSGIEVMSKPIKDIVYLNLYGIVGCSPTGFFNDDNVVEQIPFPAKKLGVNSDSFLVEARNDSMEPKIHDGDLVLADRVPPVSGDIAVVVHGGEGKIKRIYKEKGRVVLQSLNPKYAPQVVSPDKVKSVGVVRGVVHSFNSKAKKSRP